MVQVAEAQSSAEVLLFAIPMIVAMFAGFFRIDTLFSHPKTRSCPERQFSNVDENGQGACVEPDGQLHRVSRRRAPANR
jgi:hypothetical protein